MSDWSVTSSVLVIGVLLMTDHGHAVASYRVTFTTASSPPEAGTRARVSVQLYGTYNNGSLGQSQEITLQSTAANFQPGSVDTFEIDGYYGAIYKLKITSDNANSSPNWLPNQVTVEDLIGTPARIPTRFPVDRWLDVGSGLQMFLFSVVNGAYSDWSEWTTCSVTCSCPQTCTGSQSRSRTCSNPPPMMGGETCEQLGPAAETKQCENFCIIDGGVSQWSAWSVCSKECGTSQETKTRTCTEPAPLNGGADCTEPLQETRDCNTQSCVDQTTDFGQWSDWSTCSATCGGGRNLRTRVCNRKPDKTYCQGSFVQSGICNTRACRFADGTYYCGMHMWLCTGTDQCINSWEYCDGTRQCTNSADEPNCDVGTPAGITLASLAMPFLISTCVLIFVIFMLVILVCCLIKRIRELNRLA